MYIFRLVHLICIHWECIPDNRGLDMWLSMWFNKCTRTPAQLSLSRQNRVKRPCMVNISSYPSYVWVPTTIRNLNPYGCFFLWMDWPTNIFALLYIIKSIAKDWNLEHHQWLSRSSFVLRKLIWLWKLLRENYLKSPKFIIIVSIQS